MVAGLLNKYIWLVQKLIAAGERGLALEEISCLYEDRFGTKYARRTFNNHREAIEEVFGISIECNRSTNTYFIRRGADLKDTQANVSWLIDTFTVNSMLTLSKERLSGRVSVEEIPSGRKFLPLLMSALMENRILSVTYKKYGANPEILHVRPYSVKESDQRWYLIGFAEERNALRVYSLDRITDIEILPETFKMPADFDTDELFATSFGPYLSENKGITIKFKAFGNEASFIRDLPLHHSQKEILTEEDSSTFQIFASPNRNMYLEFLGHGAGIEILSPEDVRRTIQDMILKMNKLYSKP